jgi:elongation factor P
MAADYAALPNRVNGAPGAAGGSAAGSARLRAAGRRAIIRTPTSTSGRFRVLIVATQLRVGMAVLHEGNPCRVMSVQHITPGNWRGMVQTKLRNLKSGNSFEYRFRSEDRVERAELEQHDMEFLYLQADEYHFMNTETYEQVGVSREDLGDAAYYIVPNTRIILEFYQGRPVGVELPVTVDLTVVETQPGMKGATASNSGKPATLETGLQIQVPQFIDVGERVRVDTAEGKYLERAK